MTSTLKPQDQYVFLHDALDEYITCGETDVAVSNLRARMNKLRKHIPEKGITGFTEQFQVSFAVPMSPSRCLQYCLVKLSQLLEQVSSHATEDNCTVGLEFYNKNKNRYLDKLPCKCVTTSRHTSTRMHALPNMPMYGHAHIHVLRLTRIHVWTLCGDRHIFIYVHLTHTCTIIHVCTFLAHAFICVCNHTMHEVVWPLVCVCVCVCVVCVCMCMCVCVLCCVCVCMCMCVHVCVCVVLCVCVCMCVVLCVCVHVCVCVCVCCALPLLIGH